MSIAPRIEMTKIVANQARTGDETQIPGSYQYDAIHHGNAVQRFWHYNKLLTIDQYLPPAESDCILDVGCGSGVVSSFLAESGANVLGIDGNPDALSFANETYQQPNLRFQKGLVDNEFDLGMPVDKIYCLEVIEHIYLHQGQQMLEHFRRVLRPGGAVFLTTPNYRSFWPVIEWLLDRTKLVPQLADDQHVAKYHCGKFRYLAESVGFHVEALVTTCFIGPWMAPLSWRIAKRISRFETGPYFPGSILVAVLRKPESRSE